MQEARQFVEYGVDAEAEGICSLKGEFGFRVGDGEVEGRVGGIVGDIRVDRRPWCGTGERCLSPHRPIRS